MLELLRRGVHERQALLDEHGPSVRTVRLGVEVRQRLEELDQSLPRLQALLRRRSCVNKEDTQARYNDFRCLKRQIDEAKDLFHGVGLEEADRSGAQVQSAASRSKTAQFGLPHDGADEAGRPNAQRDMTCEEKAAMGHIRQRSSEMDEHLGDIGLAVDRLKDLAGQIGTSAERQKERAEVLTKDVDDAQDGITAVNASIKRYLKK
jgi:hypothetical protein